MMNVTAIGLRQVCIQYERLMIEMLLSFLKKIKIKKWTNLSLNPSRARAQWKEMLQRGSKHAAPSSVSPKQGPEQSCPTDMGPWCLLLRTHRGSPFPLCELARNQAGMWSVLRVLLQQNWETWFWIGSVWQKARFVLQCSNSVAIPCGAPILKRAGEPVPCSVRVRALCTQMK